MLVVPAIATAQDKSGAPIPKASATVVFRAPDRVAMRDYFRAHSIFATPLPARISKNVTRGHALPNGSEQDAVPSGLVELLPSRPGVTYLIVGASVVAMRHGVVVDVVFNVFR